MELTLVSYLAATNLPVLEELHHVLHMLGNHMTDAGLEFMIFAAETCGSDCWWTRSGGAALPAAIVLGVTLPEFVP